MKRKLYVFFLLLLSLFFISCSSSSIESTIDDAIKDKEQVQITYQKPNGEKSERVISDISYTDVYGRSGYIRAYCHLRKDWRTFKIDRIQSAKIVGSSSTSIWVILLSIAYVVLWYFNNKVFLFQYTFHKMHNLYGSPEDFYLPVYPTSYAIMYKLSLLRWVAVIVLLFMKFWWILLIVVICHFIGKFTKEDDYSNLEIAETEINRKALLCQISVSQYAELMNQISETRLKCK